jgi:hypothetical protein
VVQSGWLRNQRGLVDCPNTAGRPAALLKLETSLSLFNGTDRRHVAVVISSDGRRVSVPVDDAGLVDVSPFGILRFLLLGLDGLLGLITGSRRETDGLRRDERG